MRWYLTTLMALWGAAQISAQTTESEVAYSIQAAEKILQEKNLPTHDAALMEFFRKRTLNQAQIEALPSKIKQLGSNSYRERTRATKELILAGSAGKTLLLAVLKDDTSTLETHRRTKLCLRRLQEEVYLVRAASRLLGLRKTKGGAEVLLNYLPFACGISLIEEIQETLPALAMRDGRPEQTLVKAVNDPRAVKRAAAGASLVLAGALPQVPNLRLLLKDSDSEVRLQMARAMVQIHEKSGIPVLIDLIAVLPADKVWQVEEMLVLVAGPEGPQVMVDSKHTSAQVTQIWKAWWRDHQAQLNLVKIDTMTRQRGYTLITQMDSRNISGRVFEIRSNQEVVWQINGLRYPLDAHVIGSDRVLIAEYLNRRVTERDFHGNILWEKQVAMPIACQRLPNGQTFIATRRQLFIVDKTGKETFTYTPQFTSISAARRLRDGRFMLITSGGILQLVGANGGLLKSFPVGKVYTLGGNIDVLPNGHVIVPQYRDNKVVEYDTEGHALWEIRVTFPTSAVRLPNGNVLVVSMIRQQVTEVSRSGHEVWVYRTDGRPWRARRR